MQPESDGGEQCNDQKNPQSHQPYFVVVGFVKRNIFSVTPYHCTHESKCEEYSKNRLSLGEHFGYIYENKGTGL